MKIAVVYSGEVRNFHWDNHFNFLKNFNCDIFYGVYSDNFHTFESGRHRYGGGGPRLYSIPRGTKSNPKSSIHLGPWIEDIIERAGGTVPFMEKNEYQYLRSWIMKSLLDPTYRDSMMNSTMQIYAHCMTIRSIIKDIGNSKWKEYDYVLRMRYDSWVGPDTTKLFRQIFSTYSLEEKNCLFGFHASQTYGPIDKVPTDHSHYELLNTDKGLINIDKGFFHDEYAWTYISLFGDMAILYKRKIFDHEKALTLFYEDLLPPAEYAWGQFLISDQLDVYAAFTEYIFLIRKPKRDSKFQRDNLFQLGWLPAFFKKEFIKLVYRYKMQHDFAKLFGKNWEKILNKD